jgi:hypothetical protein
MQPKYKKEDLEDLILNKKLSYREIGRIYGVSDTYIKKVALKLGLVLSKRKNFKEDFEPHNKNKGVKHYCLNCDSEIISTWSKQKFCEKECEIAYKVNKKYEDYLVNQLKYCGGNFNMRWIKKHISTEQENKCAICSLQNTWNGKPLVFVLDHINGDAYNNTRDNLRLICHNCDSQLDTYKSKNKNSSRKERYLKNYK